MSRTERRINIQLGLPVRPVKPLLNSNRQLGGVLGSVATRPKLNEIRTN